MVKVTIKGKEYTLRFDMAVMEWMEDEFGSFAEAMKKLAGKGQKIDGTRRIFEAMCDSANDYLGIEEKTDASELLTKHAPMARFALVTRAIQEAVHDGTVMRTQDDEDTGVRDVFLQEAEAEEAEKNLKTGA